MRARTAFSEPFTLTIIRGRWVLIACGNGCSPITGLRSLRGWVGPRSTHLSLPGLACNSAAGCAVYSDEVGGTPEVAGVFYISLCCPACLCPHRQQGRLRRGERGTVQALRHHPHTECHSWRGY